VAHLEDVLAAFEDFLDPTRAQVRIVILVSEGTRRGSSTLDLVRTLQDLQAWDFSLLLKAVCNSISPPRKEN
jgi:hypothetical protein